MRRMESGIDLFLPKFLMFEMFVHLFIILFQLHQSFVISQQQSLADSWSMPVFHYRLLPVLHEWFDLPLHL